MTLLVNVKGILAGSKRAVGDSATVTVRFTLDASITGVIAGTVNVKWNEPDLDKTDNMVAWESVVSVQSKSQTPGAVGPEPTAETPNPNTASAEPVDSRATAQASLAQPDAAVQAPADSNGQNPIIAIAKPTAEVPVQADQPSPMDALTATGDGGCSVHQGRIDTIDGGWQLLSFGLMGWRSEAKISGNAIKSTPDYVYWDGYIHRIAEPRQKATSLADESLAISTELGMRPLMELVPCGRDILKAQLKPNWQHYSRIIRADVRNLF